jgi:hypothetical protein
MQNIPDTEEGWMWKAIGHPMPPNPTRVSQAESSHEEFEDT